MTTDRGSCLHRQLCHYAAGVSPSGTPSCRERGATTKLLTRGKRSSEMASAGPGAELLQITELCCFYS